MARVKQLSVREKRQIGWFGLVGVVLLLLRFFPPLYSQVVNAISNASKMTAQRPSSIITGIVFISLGVILMAFSKYLSFVPFLRGVWNISGIALIGLGLINAIGINPFDRGDGNVQIDPSSYNA